MTNSRSSSGDPEPTGPILYLDENTTDGHFCQLVFDGAGKTDYRVVQLTTGQSFESLQKTLDTQLQDIQDPSEAAAVILNPQRSEPEVLTAAVGTDTTMYGFQVNPEDLTGISIAFSKLLRRWEAQAGAVEVCLRGIESLFPYHDTDLLYRFLNTILATLQGAGADVHMHLNPTMVEERAQNLFTSLFTTVETLDGDVHGRESTAVSTAEASNAGSGDSVVAKTALSSESVNRTVEMAAAEIDATLEETGLGILAFAGEQPYAIPMSFGYDSGREELYLQLGAFEGSEKQARLDDSAAVTLVVLEYERPDQWRSVIVEGTLTSLTEAERAERDVLSVFAKSKLASVDVFSMDPNEVSFSWYCLEPDSMSGRKSVEVS